MLAGGDRAMCPDGVLAATRRARSFPRGADGGARSCGVHTVNLRKHGNRLAEAVRKLTARASSFSWWNGP
ncbi:hypothetical protein GCM10010430_76990 [Kitasatospora cystarginea]|uniref:Transposase n=1 Tax=Kitasatospora cystarginea TaxID=58350 RepID=A0ABN3F185_9ACTN